MFGKNIRSKPVNCKVRTQSIIKAFNVGKNGVLNSCAGIEATQMDEFALQEAEEIFRNGVVVRSALTRHALLDTELRQALLIGGSSVNTLLSE